MWISVDPENARVLHLLGTIAQRLGRAEEALIVDDLKPEERQEQGTNAGVKVAAVVKGSPAWNANILPGDVVLSLDGKLVNSGPELEQLAQEQAGRQTTVELIRGGVRQRLEVNLARS